MALVTVCINEIFYTSGSTLEQHEAGLKANNTEMSKGSFFLERLLGMAGSNYFLQSAARGLD